MDTKNEQFLTVKAGHVIRMNVFSKGLQVHGQFLHKFLPCQKADFLTPVDDSLSISVGGAVDDLDVVVDELRDEEAVGAKVDQPDSVVVGAVQEITPVWISLHHAPHEQF